MYIHRIYLKGEINGKLYITKGEEGNSQGIRLSKEVLAQMNLQENDTVGINVYDGKMTVEKINKPKYLNLTERLEAFYKRPIEEIYVESTQEVDVGDPKGNEIW